MPKPYYEPGTYLCEVTAQGFDESTKGTPYFWLAFNVLEKIEEEGNLPLQQQERIIRLWLSEKAIDISAGQLRAVGWKGNWKDLDSGKHSFEGEQMEFACRHEIYNELPHERWEFPRGSQRPEQRKGLAAKLDKKYPQNGGAAPQKASKPKPEEREPEVSEDEIPF